MMIRYEYKCRACSTIFTRFLHTDDRDTPTRHPCPHCQTPPPTIGRRFTCNFPSTLPGYFNTRGEWIDSPQAAKRSFNALHAQHEARGIHVGSSGDVLDPRELAADPAAFGVTDEGLKETHDRQVARGEKEPVGKTVHLLSGD
jgi:DNA-directed RNA polymerase subunit RPC12/RpoP